MVFLPQDVIRHKRDGLELSATEINAFIQGISRNQVADAQIGAFTMAALLRGLSRAESVALTRSMTHSGQVIDWTPAALPGPILDKHSTGGVGDKVSLILAPLIAACGGFVPMISGRGLGHTGGTLDKLESLPGYRTDLSIPELIDTVRDCGCAIIGQTGELAPADKRIYAVRDVTATVECTGLICASILSKKLAAGLQGLVLDVKSGSGAFLPDPADSLNLAQELVAIGTGAGLPTVAVLTDMNQVLGHSAGNALEVLEAVRFLTGAEREPRLLEVTLALAEAMLRLGELAQDSAAARQKAQHALDSGAAAERFARMVKRLGGPADVLGRAEDYLPSASVRLPVHSAQAGYIQAMDVCAIGQAIVALGGGRRRTDDSIDPAVGLTEVAGIGAWVDNNQALAWVHAGDELAAQEAAEVLRSAMRIADAPVSTTAPVLQTITADD